MRRIILSFATVLFSLSVAGTSAFAGDKKDCGCDHKNKAAKKEECKNCHKDKKDCKDGKCKHEHKAEEKKAE